MNESNESKELSLVKIGLLAFAGSFSLIVALNSYTVVSAGTTKVKTTFGTVSQTAYSEGLHFPVNPLASFDVMDTRNSKYEVEALNIPTQDRFNSTGNVTVLYRIDWQKTPYIKQNYGTVEEYISKTLRQQLRSIIRDEGRKIPDSRGLAMSDNINVMQQSAKTRLIDTLSGTGINIQDVLVQDIQFDIRIAKQILDTQKRIQQEEAKKSQERTAKTDAAIKKQNAIGEANIVREKADAESYRIERTAAATEKAAISEATGKAEAVKLEADALAYSIKERAKANHKLTSSLTVVILEKQRLDNEAILYSKSVGNVPATIIGETNLRAIGVPIAGTAQ